MKKFLFTSILVLTVLLGSKNLTMALEPCDFEPDGTPIYDCTPSVDECGTSKSTAKVYQLNFNNVFCTFESIYDDDYIKFTPPVSGTYDIESSNSLLNLKIMIYDSEMNYIENSTVYFYNSDVDFELDLIQNETIYLKITNRTATNGTTLNFKIDYDYTIDSAISNYMISANKTTFDYQTLGYHGDNDNINGKNYMYYIKENSYGGRTIIYFEYKIYRRSGSVLATTESREAYIQIEILTNINMLLKDNELTYSGTSVAQWGNYFQIRDVDMSIDLATDKADFFVEQSLSTTFQEDWQLDMDEQVPALIGLVPVVGPYIGYAVDTLNQEFTRYSFTNGTENYGSLILSQDTLGENTDIVRKIWLDTTGSNTFLTFDNDKITFKGLLNHIGEKGSLDEDTSYDLQYDRYVRRKIIYNINYKIKLPTGEYVTIDLTDNEYYTRDIEGDSDKPGPILMF